MILPHQGQENAFPRILVRFSPVYAVFAGNWNPSSPDEWNRSGPFQKIWQPYDTTVAPESGERL